MCQSGEITVWGEAPIFASVVAARSKARLEACRRAVEKCIGEEISSVTGVSSGQSIVNEIFSKAKAICKDDKLLEEETYELDKVKILKAFYRFRVKRAQLRDSIQVMKELVGNPKVMVLIREEYNLPRKQVEKFGSRKGLAGQVLRDHLISKGYSVIDPAKISRHLRNEKHLAGNPDSIGEKVKDAAVKAGADVLIVGLVEANPQNIAALRDSGIKSFRATGSITILSLWGSSRVLGEYSKSEPGAQVTALAAARAAASAFAKGRDRREVGGMVVYVDKQLTKEWSEITRNNRIEMTVNGLGPELAGIFRDDLEEATAVKDVDEISATTKKAKWEVRYPGRSFALADTLNFYADNPKIFSVLRQPQCQRLKVLSVSRGEIALKFFGAGCAK